MHVGRLWWVALLVGCGVAPGVLQGEGAGSIEVRGIGIEPPQPPVPPKLTPCAPGWHEAEGGWCSPWATAESCGDDGAHFPGEASCRRVGTACPADGWPQLEGAVVYVKAGATNGSGTKAAPFGGITQAMASVASGTVIAIAPGVYEEAVQLKGGVTLHGACVSGTHLKGPAGAQAAIRVVGLGAGLKNLRVSGASFGVMVGSSGTSLKLEDVIVDSATKVGVIVGNTASLEGHDVVIRRTLPSGTGGIGLDAEYGGRITIQRIVLEDNRESAVQVAGGSNVALDQAAIRRTFPRSDGQMGYGAALREQSVLTLTHSIIEDLAQGVLVGRDATAHISDSIVQRASDAEGACVTTQGHATLMMERVALLDSPAMGLRLMEAKAKLVDVLIQDTGRARLAAGIQLSTQSEVEVERLQVVRAGRAGILLVDPGSSLRGADVRLIAPQSFNDEDGAGLVLEVGTRAELQRVAIAQSHTFGLMLSNAEATIEDLSIVDTASELRSGAWGRGVHLQRASKLSLRRAVLSNNVDVGLMMIDASSAQLTDVRVEKTLHATCVKTGRCGEGGGIGVFVGGSNSVVTLDRFDIADNVACGLHVAEGGVADATAGQIRNNAIGLCAQSEGYDLGRVSNGVSFETNGQKVSSEQLPLPNLTPRATLK